MGNSMYEECPFCDTEELPGDRIAHHIWTNHRDEIEAAANRDRIQLPTSVAAYHDELFASICEHLEDRDAVSDGTRVAELSLKVTVEEPVAVTDVVEATDE